MMTIIASTLGDIRCELGENPLWHGAEKCLYWTDIPAGRIYRYDPNSGVVEKVFEGGVVGGFTIQADNTLLLFMEGGQIAQLKNGKINTLIEEIPDEDEVTKLERAWTRAVLLHVTLWSRAYVAEDLW